MRTALALVLALVMLAGCGTRKPLIKPKDIPAYEAKRERKKEQLEEDQADAPDTAPADEAPQNAAPTQPATSAP